MGYFEGLADASLKQDSQGNTVFYPWGILAKGRVLSDEATTIALRKFIILYYQITLPVILLTVFLKLWWLALILTPILFGWFFIKSRQLTKNCPISAEKLTMKDSYKNSARSHNLIMLWLMLLASLIFVVGGVLMFIKGQIFMGLGGIIFFGLCSLVFIFMIKAKINNQ